MKIDFRYLSRKKRRLILILFGAISLLIPILTLYFISPENFSWKYILYYLGLILITGLVELPISNWLKYRKSNSQAFDALKNHFELQGFQEIVIQGNKSLIGVSEGMVVSMDLLFEKIRIGGFFYFPRENEKFLRGYFTHYEETPIDSMTPYDEILEDSAKKVKQFLIDYNDEEPTMNFSYWPEKELDTLMTLLANPKKVEKEWFSREILRERIEKHEAKNSD